MTFSQLNYVIEIAKSGSINKAATRLFVSQSSLSNSIAELERELDITIFARSTKGIELTADGSEFLSYIRPLVDQQQKIKDIYSKKTNIPCVRLSISTQRYPFAVKAFTELINNANLDKYELRMRETSIYQVIEDVSSNDSSIGIIFISRETEKFIKKVLDSKGMEFFPLLSATPHVFLRKNHPLASNNELQYEDLEGFPYVVFDYGQTKSLYYTEEVSLIGFKMPEQMIYVYDRATIYNVLHNTDAFSIGSGILPEGFYDHDITSIPIKCDDEMQIGWIKSIEHNTNAVEDKFIEYLNGRFKD